jgi:hypothetical protein
MAVDGDVEKTSRVMNESDLERCLRVLWKCRKAAAAVKEE